MNDEDMASKLSDPLGEVCMDRDYPNPFKNAHAAAGRRTDTAALRGNGGVQDRGIVLAPITTAEELKQVMFNAEADGHRNMLLPSHAWVKHGRIIGCTSIGNVILSNSWVLQDSERVRPRDTVECFRLGEQLARGVGYKAIAVPVPKSSPLHGVMVSRLGYQDVGEFTVFVKSLMVKMG